MSKQYTLSIYPQLMKLSRQAISPSVDEILGLKVLLQSSCYTWSLRVWCVDLH